MKATKQNQINWSQVNRSLNSWELEYSKIQGATLSQKIKQIIKRVIK